MIVGVPREVKAEENRVAITPSSVGALVAHGHQVLGEHDAGGGSSLPDRLYADEDALFGQPETLRTQEVVCLRRGMRGRPMGCKG